MTILFIIGILLGATVVVFALQNTEIITVSFFSWQFTGSLSFILFLTIMMGILTAILLMLPESINNYFKYRNLKKENEKLEEELRKQIELTVFAKKVLPTVEEITKIEQGKN